MNHRPTASMSTPRRDDLHRRHVLLAGLAGAGALLVARPARAEAAAYEIDPDHLAIGFLVEHIGYAKTLGMFRKARGSYRFDEASGALSDVRIEVDTASVDTNHDKRDAHLKSQEFLHVSKYPTMVFTAAAGTPAGERRYRLDGQLELIGQRQPVSLEATWNKSAPSPLPGLRKPYIMGVSARGSFKRSAFGMNYAVANGWVGDEVQLIIEFEAVRQ